MGRAEGNVSSLPVVGIQVSHFSSIDCLEDASHFYCGGGVLDPYQVSTGTSLAEGGRSASLLLPEWHPLAPHGECWLHYHWV